MQTRGGGGVEKRDSVEYSATILISSSNFRSHAEESCVALQATSFYIVHFLYFRFYFGSIESCQASAWVCILMMSFSCFPSRTLVSKTADWRRRAAFISFLNSSFVFLIPNLHFNNPPILFYLSYEQKEFASVGFRLCLIQLLMWEEEREVMQEELCGEWRCSFQQNGEKKQDLYVMREKYHLHIWLFWNVQVSTAILDEKRQTDRKSYRPACLMPAVRAGRALNNVRCVTSQWLQDISQDCRNAWQRYWGKQSLACFNLGI